MARKQYALNINGDIEQGVADWAIGNGTLAQITTPGTPGWAGTKSLQWTRASGTASWSLRSESIGVKPGRVYDLTASCYPTTADASLAFPRLEFFDSGGASISVLGNAYANTTAGTWTTRTATVTAPAGAVTASINCGIASTVAIENPVTFDELWATGRFTITVTATTHPDPESDSWVVKLSPSTDALAAEYGAYRIWRDGVSQEYLQGELPSSWTGSQPAGTTSTWRVALYKNVTYPGGADDWEPITTTSQGSTVVTTSGPAGQSAIITADGQIAWVEIQSWPELRYTRRSATLQIMGSSNPVVVSDPAVMAQSSPVLITRTTAARDQLVKVLSTSGPLRIEPYCTGLDAPWVMPLDFNVTRRANKASNTIWLTELVMQHIDAPVLDSEDFTAAAQSAGTNDGPGPAKETA